MIIVDMICYLQQAVVNQHSIIKEISSKDKGDFLNRYHIQGNDKSNIKLGL